MHLFIWTVICGIFMTNVFATDLYTEADSGKIKRYRPALIRTELRVSKSLDPSKTETINVKANNGGYASIIVKKRNGNTRNYYKPVNSGTTKPSNSVRFEEPTDQKSVELINYFMQHFDQINTATSTQRQRQLQRHPSGIITADRSGVINSDRSFQDNKPVYMSVPDPVVISSSPFYVKNSPAPSQKRGRSLMKTTIDTDGIPVVEGIRVPDDEEDKKKVWRNARVIKGELVPYEKGYKPPKAEYLGKKIYAEIIPDTKLNEQQRFTRQSSGRSIGPFTTSDNFPKEDPVRGVGPFSIEDIKQGASSREGKGPFFVRDNAVRGNGAKFIDYIKQINEQQGRSNYFESRNMNSEPQMQRRMLQNNPYEDDESPRAPVFEYAHPDLGIQPATAVANNNEIGQKSEKVQYYTNLGMMQQQQHQGELNTQEYYSNIPQATYPYNYGYLKRVHEEPMWKKLTDQVRSRFQSGITAVESLARPVIEPIMEAGNKISENLGFNNKNYAQDKVGLAAPAAAIAAGPSLLPALGLMAGGAALGIGALAVGRYFDENLLQRSDTEEYDPEHKRLLENSHRIYKRSLEDEDLQNIEVDLSKMKKTVEQTVRDANWKDAECAKRMFCDIMVAKDDDEMSFMQKRIDGLLKRLKEKSRATITRHLDEVTDAINQHNCGVFKCTMY